MFFYVSCALYFSLNMENRPQDIDISRIRTLFPLEYMAELGQDVLIAEVKYSEALKMLAHPTRFDCYIALFCAQGSIKVDINLGTYTVNENTVLFNIPGNIFRVSEIDEEKLGDIRFVILIFSKEFIGNLRFDFDRLFNESLSVIFNPCLRIEGETLSICKQFFALLKSVIDSNVDSRKDIVASLVSSVMYLFGSSWERQISEARSEASRDPSARAKFVFEEFLKLVSTYHGSFRSMQFYADKLCLTPKYLSHIIKKASGRSAPDWIDEFVILEAKNLLKHSEMPVKQIVANLNFNNLSVFHKFFKSHTGMTPIEYRNS